MLYECLSVRFVGEAVEFDAVEEVDALSSPAALLLDALRAKENDGIAHVAFFGDWLLHMLRCCTCRQQL